MRVPDPLAGVSWEVLRWMGIDAATCLLGDAGDFTGEVRLEQAYGKLIGRLRAFVLPGRQLAVLNTGGDIDVPIEVARQADEIVAVRLCLVDDVDVADGTWVSLGRITIGGRAIAADPFYVPSDFYWETFAVRPGTYIAEVFDFDGDLLALRIHCS